MKIEIDGKILTQWDTDRWVFADSNEVHFADSSSTEALVVDVVDGKAPIPNILLQKSGILKAWEVSYTENGERTISVESVFNVRSKQKPSDYVYTETEVLCYESLEKRIAELEKNGGGSSGNITVDSALSKTSENPVQNKVITAEIDSLKESIENLPTGGGISTKAKNLLITILRNGLFNTNQSDNITELESALGTYEPDEPEEPDTPVATLTSISAVYTGGEVEAGTSVNSLTGITVTAHYSDGTSKNVTGYTLSGNIVEGTNTITVSYGGKTTTFTVVAVSTPEEPDTPVEPEKIYYTITNSLTNVSSDNPVSSVLENGGYMATLTIADGYELESVVVTMGGIDVTSSVYNDGVITISKVTGNVVITAIANEVVTEEVFMLKNIKFDGGSYLNTEFIPNDVSYRYVLGVKIPKYLNGTVYSTKYFAGVSMRDHTSQVESNYLDYVFGGMTTNNNYNEEAPKASIGVGFGSISISNQLSSGNDKGDSLTSQPYNMPFYMNISDGNQSIWIDESLSTQPVTGYFPALSATFSLSGDQYYNPEKMPIKPMWLGRVNTASESTASLYNNHIMYGPEFYCFKVYDSSDNLIVNMRPAKQGATIGMYDEVRAKFYPVNLNGGTVTYEEVEA